MKHSSCSLPITSLRLALGSLALPALLSCAGAAEPEPPNGQTIYNIVSGCYAIEATSLEGSRWVVARDDGFELLDADPGEAARFHARAADLGTYLFRDAEGSYLLAGDEGGLLRERELLSDVLLVDDSYVSPAEWDVEVSTWNANRFQLRNRWTRQYLGTSGLVEHATQSAIIELHPRTGCSEFPELTLDAEGSAERRTWDDGAVYGIVETHAHLFTNFGFGGGGMFHGSPFHRLGVEHALPSCEPFHGVDGRRDIIGFAFSGLSDIDPSGLVPIFVTGMTPTPNHRTDGYPTFSDWPSAWEHATHQMQYYRWIERAYLGGLRLMVQHMTTNSVLCEFISGIGAGRTRYSCNDMVAVDREIAETYALERYIDAQSGGPGMGWFRIVTSPEEARQVIREGRLAVVLGIETSNLFDCLLTPRPGYPVCDEAHVVAQLDRYHELGVRVMFPVHKLDNAFSAGDGDRNVGQIGSFINSGHWSNFVQDCPDLPSVFDRGGVLLGGLNMPRDEYMSPPPNDMSNFAENPTGVLTRFLSQILEPPLDGEWCQNAGLTPLGETLIREMMRRGMIVELDHLPRRSYQRAFEMLMEEDYPAVGSHGNTNRGLLYEIGGVSKINFGRCSAPDRRGALGDGLRARIAEITEHGGYPAEGFGFDLNGFAGGMEPRFGPDSPCTTEQSNPVEYPFDSYAGDVTFTQPHLGERTVDYNTEGMLHLGLLPELIEEARRDGVTDAELEPLFRSAEGYLRMWERAEERAAMIRAR